MKAYVPIICTIIICATVIYIVNMNNQKDRYIYTHSNLESGSLVRIDRYTNQTHVLRFPRGWITPEQTAEK
ncbi:hypothetical protein [Paenibacillus sp. FSL H7-0331]|uniref:hypothetical protein n=1 Tax=Paenibacillus sp. FSL H7-0331 TaxID=1920421 RepID=UPI00096D8301|nr:hypothetical protein [Paenibacillus sp. FSL H7-0331]OME97374.1 hypothetical protein BK127_40545 [Paenibacillus sp. FSL H7-0331]